METVNLSVREIDFILHACEYFRENTVLRRGICTRSYQDKRFKTRDVDALIKKLIADRRAL